jgi:hypothetical protein
MSKLAAKILGMFVSEIPAGACVTDHGCCCGKKGHAVGCHGACVKQATCRTGGTCLV